MGRLGHFTCSFISLRPQRQDTFLIGPTLLKGNFCGNVLAPEHNHVSLTITDPN
jgi:hypothetical protein